MADECARYRGLKFGSEIRLIDLPLPNASVSAQSETRGPNGWGGSNTCLLLGGINFLGAHRHMPMGRSAQGIFSLPHMDYEFRDALSIYNGLSGRLNKRRQKQTWLIESSA
jgi:hypothetical protein